MLCADDGARGGLDREDDATARGGVQSNLAMYIALLPFQLVCLTEGIAATYAAAFLYEDDEKRIQDSLAGWWVALRDLEGGMIPRARALIGKSNEVVESFLGHLFGEKIVSVRFFSVAVVLSQIPLVSIFGVVPLFSALDTVLPHGLSEWYGDLLLFVILGPPIGMTVLALRRGEWFGRIAAGLLLLVVGTVLFPAGDNSRWWFVKMVFLGILSNAAITAVLRAFLRSFGAEAPIVFAISVPFGVYAIVAVAAFLSILIGGPFTPGFVVLSNVFALFCAALILVLPMVLVVGKPLVDVLNRAIYSAQRYNLIQNKKFLWAVALFFFALTPRLGPLTRHIKSLIV